MAYIALKPCKFAGQAFKIGDAVPDEFIHAGAAKNLVKMQKIAPADSVNASAAPNKGPIPVPPIAITARAENGDIPLGLTDIGLQQIFDALTSNVENAENIVNTMTDGDALILLNMADSRKSIKAAAEARAKSLEEEKADSAGDE